MVAIATIDVEASGFGRGSYPIEIGFVLANGESHCMLVRPEPDWQHWDKSAEQLHGISRQTLLGYGKPIIYVANILNRYLSQQTVYSDAWGNDSSWLAYLFETAAIKQLFKLESVSALLDENQQALWHDTKEQLADRLSITRHRASGDAKLLQQTWQHVEQLSRANYPRGDILSP